MKNKKQYDLINLKLPFGVIEDDRMQAFLASTTQENYEEKAKAYEQSEEYKEILSDFEKKYRKEKMIERKKKCIQYVKANILSFILIIIGLATLLVTILK